MIDVINKKEYLEKLKDRLDELLELSDSAAAGFDDGFYIGQCELLNTLINELERKYLAVIDYMDKRPTQKRLVCSNDPQSILKEYQDVSSIRVYDENGYFIDAGIIDEERNYVSFVLSETNKKPYLWAANDFQKLINEEKAKIDHKMDQEDEQEIER